MDTNNSFKFLTALLEREKPTESDVNSLLANVPTEDQYIEYKSGQQPADQLRTVVRRWTTGFANADAGVLAIGISEPDKESGAPRKVVGIDVPGGGPADEWASRILQPFTGRFLLPPRFVLTKHPDGDVLFIAVDRAPQLISYAEANEPRYALRIFESTVDVPSYLISDLLLGRRNHPTLKVRNVTVEGVADTRNPTIPVRIGVEIENMSFVKSIDTDMWTVAWSLFLDDPRPNEHLLQQIDADPPMTNAATLKSMRGRKWGIFRSQVLNAPALIRPFGVFQGAALVAEMPWDPVTAQMTFALYLMPENSMPLWYEVKVRYYLGDEVEAKREIKGTATFEPMTTRRARLAWWA